MIDKDRVAVITGATGNLGSVVARSFAEQGLKLALLSTNLERLAELANELGLSEEHILTGAYDLTSHEEVQDAANAVMGKFRRVDILVHLVGGWIGGQPVTEVGAEEVAGMLNQHLWTTFHLTQAFVQALTANNWGRIIVVSSPLASNPPPKMAPYVVGKAAQEALVLTVAKEVAGSGVTANILQVRSIDAKHERERQPSSKNSNWTTPEEITGTILYLCSTEAHVVNGARIPLYGS
jgi:NAD(P)-dependent dehydrogenase (short-subunit alcohol dehydrogenase family)